MTKSKLIRQQVAKFGTYLGVMLFLLASCQKVDQVPVDKTSMESLVVDDNFNFSTKEDVNLSLQLKDALGMPASQVVLEVFHAKSDQSIFKGLTDANGKIEATVNVPTQLNEFVVIANAKGFYTPVKIGFSAGNKQLSAQLVSRVGFGLNKKSGGACTIEAGAFRTQTQGGWGTGANGNNPGVYRDANFDAAFPNGLTVGSCNTLTFTNSAAIEAFLPQGGSPKKALSKSYVNPTSKISVLAGQLVALSLSVGFDEYDADFGSSSAVLGELIIGSGTFQGWTVYQLLAEANKAFGGKKSKYNLSTINDALSSINENFVDGNSAGSFLTCPEQEEEPDEDQDNVPDHEDEYPNDPQKAFNNNLDGTLVYEDLWPSKGDFDFNDLVTDYTYNLITNADNKVVELEIQFEVRAIGASFHNGLALSFDMPAAAVAMVTGQHVGEYINTENNGTETGHTNAVIPIFEDAFDILPHPGQGHQFVNTYPAPQEPSFEPQLTNKIVVSLVEPVAIDALGKQPFNPFLIKNAAREKEIHLADFANTALADESIFGTFDDTTNPGANRYYRTSNNIPWALHLPVNFAYPIEKTDINKAYLKFAAWAESGGSQYTDWYEDEEGYRNEAYIYK